MEVVFLTSFVEENVSGEEKKVRAAWRISTRGRRKVSPMHGPLQRQRGDGGYDWTSVKRAPRRSQDWVETYEQDPSTLRVCLRLHSRHAIWHHRMLRLPCIKRSR